MTPAEADFWRCLVFIGAVGAAGIIGKWTADWLEARRVRRILKPRKPSR